MKKITIFFICVMLAAFKLAAQTVESFTLINAATNQPIQTITDGSTLNLATLPTRELNIRANTNPATVGSVVFNLSGKQTKNQTESVAPYALFGDNSGNYNSWTPATGSYSLKATPYSSAGGGGTAGTSLSISFSVVDQAASEEYTLAVITNGSGTVSKSPDQSSYASGTSVSLTATPASGYQFSGWSGDATGTNNPLSVSMDSNKSITANFKQSTSSTQSVESFTLINAATNQPIQTITDGSTLNLATLPTRELSIRANANPATVGSVVFNLSGKQTKNQTESAAPYALFGDNSGNYNSWTPATGSYSLKATPYSSTGGNGTAGTSLSISFSVVDQAASEEYTLAVSTNGSGTVSKSPDQASYTSGTSVSLTATPAKGYQFSGWSGDATGTNNPLSVSMTSNKSIIANFKQNSTVQGFTSITRLAPIPVSSNTADKPQSKVWQHDGKWWAILPDSNGTHLWRLDSTTWTNVLTVSPSGSGKADCKVVGNLVYILLFRGEGSTSYTVVIEYVSASKTYQLWSQRKKRAAIPFDAGVETASMEIDKNGRMWVASDGISDINVRWSDAPYTTWSAPITIASGVNEDDICGIITLPGKIGVLWSNQNTKRFGFKTHTDGEDPADWSADEVPASQSALNVGYGMADDHVNMAVAGDGTLYCAVKTGYETAGYPKVALLVRRPNSTWDNLYEVTQDIGTRPIVILNEAQGKLKVIYTSSEYGGDILYKESSTANISFGAQFALLSGKYNFSTSSKANYNSEVVVMATDLTTKPFQAVSILGTDGPSGHAPGDPLSASSTGNVADIAVEPLAKKRELLAYPNPFVSQSTINFVLPEDGPYEVVLYDIMGQQEIMLDQGRAGAGKLNTVEIDGSRLPRGIYIVRLKTARSVKTLRLMLDK